MTPSSPARELRIPASLLSSLRSEAGAPALEAAGAETGMWLAHTLAEALGTDALAQVPTAAFWSTLDEVLRSRGWGSLRVERIHAGIGVVVAEGWGEAAGGGATDPNAPGCPFTVGLLGALFTRVSGAPVRVRELACEAREAGDACRFAFGSHAAMDALAGALDQGIPEEAALVRI